MGFGVLVGCAVWVGGGVGLTVGAVVGVEVGRDVGGTICVGWLVGGLVGSLVGGVVPVGAGVSPPGGIVGPSVGVAAGLRLGLTAVIVLVGDGDGVAVGDAEADEEPGTCVAGAVAEGSVVAGPAPGDVLALGDWPTAVLPLGWAGPTIGEVGMPNVPTANAIVARARFRMPRAMTRRARWTDVTAIRDSRIDRLGPPSGVHAGCRIVPPRLARSTWSGPVR